MNSPFQDIFPTPSAKSAPGGIYDHNPAPAVGTPRASSGIPVKMAEDLGAKPGAIDTTFQDAIELNHGAQGSAPKPGGMDSPFRDK